MLAEENCPFYLRIGIIGNYIYLPLFTEDIRINITDLIILLFMCFMMRIYQSIYYKSGPSQYLNIADFLSYSKQLLLLLWNAENFLHNYVLEVTQGLAVRARKSIMARAISLSSSCGSG